MTTRDEWIEQQESSSDNRVVAIPASELRQLLRDAMAFADALRDGQEDGVNILREVSSEWEHTANAGEVRCHSRMIEGVLCRWWGDGPEPKGVAIIDGRIIEPVGMRGCLEKLLVWLTKVPYIDAQGREHKSFAAFFDLEPFTVRINEAEAALSAPPIEPVGMRELLERAVPLVSGANKKWHREVKAALSASEPQVVVDRVREVQETEFGDTYIYLPVDPEQFGKGDRIRVVGWREPDGRH